MNLTDPIFHGVYRGRSKHAGKETHSTILHPSLEGLVIDDFEAVISRAHAAGVGSMIITGTSLRESKKALEIAKKYGGQIMSWADWRPLTTPIQTYMPLWDAILLGRPNLRNSGEAPVPIFKRWTICWKQACTTRRDE